ncbi:DDE_3 domain-containing protein [Trichonephila clavipes]|nr:DDE_3 domain-containing protein [Trichonephila clavipes]
MLPGSSTSLTALFHGCGSHLKLKLLECVVDGTGEVVLEVRRLQKTDISSYINKKEQAHLSSAGGKSVSCCLSKADLPKNCCQTFEGRRTIRTQTCCVCPIVPYHGVGRLHDKWPQAATCGCEWDYDGPTIHCEVLLPHVRLFRGAAGDKFVFMDDNATCHRTLAVQDCLGSEGIQRLIWPARSPDLNPIENVWVALERQVAGRNYPPTNKNTLICALTEEWDKLPQQLVDNIVQSIVRRVECCITLHGGHIPY